MSINLDGGRGTQVQLTSTGFAAQKAGRLSLQRLNATTEQEDYGRRENAISECARMK